jgi:hypothetical protein
MAVSATPDDENAFYGKLTKYTQPLTDFQTRCPHAKDISPDVRLNYLSAF